MEEEFQLVDVETGHLSGRAEEVLASTGDDGEGIEHELQRSQVETVTPVCRSLEEVGAELLRLRRVLASAAGDAGCRIVAAGTHPDADWAGQQATDLPAYQRIRDEYAHLGREQVVFGCHVHIGIADRDLRVRTMDRVRPRLSVLLALSASSPFWEGEDTGFASFRHMVFGRWPTFVTPSEFGSWAAFDSHLSMLMETGSVDDPGRLYWTVRPSSNFDTLEFRVCDACTTVDEAELLAGLIRALVTVAEDAANRGEPVPDVRPEEVRVAEWRAARWGLEDSLVDTVARRSGPAEEVVARFVDHIRPGLDANGDTATVMTRLNRVLSGGNSAARQRAAFRRRTELDDVVTALVGETAIVPAC